MGKKKFLPALDPSNGCGGGGFHLGGFIIRAGPKFNFFYKTEKGKKNGWYNGGFFRCLKIKFGNE